MSASSPKKRHRKQRQRRQNVNTSAQVSTVRHGAVSVTNGQADKVGAMLACPTGDGNINFTIGVAMAWAMRATSDPSFPFSFDVHVEAGVKGIEFARNRIVEKFMAKTTAEWLYMVDADQVVPQNFYEVMLVDNADVVGGLTYTWMNNGAPHTMLRVNQYGVNGENECFNISPPPPAVALNMPYLVPVVGTGCIAIRRRVFEKLGNNPFYFTRHETGRIRGGEDINFSVDARRAGFQIAVHPGVRFGHVKPIDISQVAIFHEARAAFDAQGYELAPNDTLSIS